MFIEARFVSTNRLHLSEQHLVIICTESCPAPNPFSGGIGLGGCLTDVSEPATAGITTQMWDNYDHLAAC